ncbi:hypothetical protein [Novosphingobium taihuense]|uniref:DUF2946 family protein n=1 Tax=Novosphingobium taihuense TaxID=260085 RepID=A0A7W7ETE8_9SPHN|nr:hypothetical protein [Novosphingobium taihuense]MBB4613172.1 hypothetical protein [Novosphingobium taihuense]TWH85313.1 hypothetical protein IQ25_02072 [Novosphingobium taihuense]
MGGLRTSLTLHYRLAILLVALALGMKALVPAGFMVEGSARSLTVLVCADSTGARSSVEITIPQSGTKVPALAKAHESCAFSTLGFAALAATDPVQLAIALVFILALGILARVTIAPRERRRLLPPPCGPPYGLPA